MTDSKGGATVRLSAEIHGWLEDVQYEEKKQTGEKPTLGSLVERAILFYQQHGNVKVPLPESSDRIELVKSALTKVSIQGKTDTRSRITHELADKIRQIQESTCEDAKRWLTGGCKLLLEAVAVAWEHLDVHKQRAEQAAKQSGRTDDAATKSETGGAKSGDTGTEGGQGDDKGAIPTHPPKRPRRKAS